MRRQLINLKPLRRAAALCALAVPLLACLEEASFSAPSAPEHQPAPIAAPGTPPASQGCDNLPEPGTWENVTPAGKTPRAVKGTVGAGIVVDPFDPRRVWLGTGSQDGAIWRSENCGSTWTKANKGRGSVSDGAQWSMQVDPVTSGVMYATSGYGAQSLWKTTDAGHSWSDVLAGTLYSRVAYQRFVNNVSLDPTNHLHLVVSTHGPCDAPYAPSCIAESADGGSTWKVMVAPEAWTEGGGLIIVKGGVWVWCGTKLLVTKDSGHTWSSDALNGDGNCEAEYTIRPFVPASNGKYYLGSRYGVLRSSDGAKWEHIPGSTGLMVMIAQGSKKIFAADQWHPTLKWASLDNDQVWHDLPAPPQISQGTDGGIPFLAYDDTHGILYASLFTGGVARMVVR
ncbi:MAG TPA: hypothetical protein VK652_03925 [Steroidobacteraceae bacterium]|nr:hypothetical protein [Steroidobacteraceae bacterium]